MSGFFAKFVHCVFLVENVYLLSLLTHSHPTHTYSHPLSPTLTPLTHQLPEWTEVQGDVRLTPFHDMHKCMCAMTQRVEVLNADVSVLPTRGPVSKYVLDDEGRKGTVSLEWTGAPIKASGEGVCI